MQVGRRDEDGCLSRDILGLYPLLIANLLLILAYDRSQEIESECMGDVYEVPANLFSTTYVTSFSLHNSVMAVSYRSPFVTYSARIQPVTTLLHATEVRAREAGATSIVSLILINWLVAQLCSRAFDLDMAYYMIY